MNYFHEDQRETPSCPCPKCLGERVDQDTCNECYGNGFVEVDLKEEKFWHGVDNYSDKK